jgi:hypothetical protein
VIDTKVQRFALEPRTSEPYAEIRISV